MSPIYVKHEPCWLDGHGDHDWRNCPSPHLLFTNDDEPADE